MTKNANKTIARDPQRADLVKKVADIHGVSTQYIYQILKCQRENEEIFSTYMFLLQEGNALVEAARQMVPFSKQTKKA